MTAPCGLSGPCAPSLLGRLRRDLSVRVTFRLYLKDSDLVLKNPREPRDASRAAQRYCGCGGMVDRVCGRCRTVGICRFVDLVIQRIGIWHIRKPCGMALCCA